MSLKLDRAIEIIQEEFNPIVIYLFGLAAKDELKREVGLINLSEASTVFKAQIIGTGKVIYCKNNTERMYFEMRSLKEYALLNEERECILNKIKERDSVYGK